jgi:hypothetical protein
MQHLLLSNVYGSLNDSRCYYTLTILIVYIIRRNHNIIYTINNIRSIYCRDILMIIIGIITMINSHL